MHLACHAKCLSKKNPISSNKNNETVIQSCWTKLSPKSQYASGHCSWSPTQCHPSKVAHVRTERKTNGSADLQVPRQNPRGPLRAVNKGEAEERKYTCVHGDFLFYIQKLNTLYFLFPSFWERDGRCGADCATNVFVLLFKTNAWIFKLKVFSAGQCLCLKHMKIVFCCEIRGVINMLNHLCASRNPDACLSKQGRVLGYGLSDKSLLILGLLS